MTNPYETYNNEIGVRLEYLLQDQDRRHSESIQVMTFLSFKMKVFRNPGLKLRTARGAGNTVLLRWSNLPDEWQESLIAKFGQPVKETLIMQGYYKFDQAAQKFFEEFTFEDDTHLSPEQIRNYTLTASLIGAIDSLRIERETMRKRGGGSFKNLWNSVVGDFLLFLPDFRERCNFHYKIPTHPRRLREMLLTFRTKQGYDYAYLIDGRSRNMAAQKVKDSEQRALVEELLGKHQNFDNEQIAAFYNIAATKLQWKMITASTVANYRKAFDLYTFAGRRGETPFRHNKMMQVKRRGPSVAMAYWTVDGWDAELLYQKFEDGRTTYHNRLSVVVVLDPSFKYPIGYAIGTHENPSLITAALRDAVNHTRELFGDRYRPLQLQSDRYAIKTLSPIYEALSGHFTPARARNAKSKVIEPYFLHLNKMCQKYFGRNWSGFGVTSDKDNQPSADYLNKIRHSFPDEEGVRQQIVRLITLERQAKIEAYLKSWETLPESDRLPLSTTDYLYYLGQTHTHTLKLRGEGLTPTLLGQSLTFDSFDPRFRECAFMDWAIKYDPQDLSTVLALNAVSDRSTSRLKEISGTVRFELTEKYIQPMALYDRKDGDSEQLAKIQQYNKSLEQSVIERGGKRREIIEELLPHLDDTLTKMILTDSEGQHKNLKSQARLEPKAVKSLPPIDGDDFEIIDDVRNQY